MSRGQQGRRLVLGLGAALLVGGWGVMRQAEITVELLNYAQRKPGDEFYSTKAVAFKQVDTLCAPQVGWKVVIGHET